MFVVASFVLLVYSYAENWRNSLLGTAVILLGVPLYTVFRKKIQ
jgi:APA family basic amino acid/polyamine antiporter